MVNFYSENDFQLEHDEAIKLWIEEVVSAESRILGDIDYIFCSDGYLLNINQEFLKHDTYTDIVTFDNSLGQQLNAEIYISTDRVTENAETYGTEFLNELHRVMIHGIYHLCGYGDKNNEEADRMRAKENEGLSMRKFV